MIRHVIYQSKRYTKQLSERVLLWTPRILLMTFIALITLYTYITFYKDSRMPITLQDAFIYFLPTVIMLMLLWIGWKHQLLDGVIILVLSFMFLSIYHAWMSLATFGLSLLIGVIFIESNYRLNHLKGYRRRDNGEII